MKKFLLIALALFPFTADAQTATTAADIRLSWEQSTTREPVPPATVGVALAATEIAKNTIYYVVDGTIPVNAAGFVTKPLPSTVQAIDISGTLTRTVTIPLAPRVAAYSIQFGLTTTDVFGLESKPALKVATVTVKPSASPAVPTSFTIQITCANGACTVTPVP